jgi:hypothetical protein
MYILLSWSSFPLLIHYQAKVLVPGKVLVHSHIEMILHHNRELSESYFVKELPLSSPAEFVITMPFAFSKFMCDVTFVR